MLLSSHLMHQEITRRSHTSAKGFIASLEVACTMTFVHNSLSSSTERVFTMNDRHTNAKEICPQRHTVVSMKTRNLFLFLIIMVERG
jgi:enolase